MSDATGACAMRRPNSTLQPARSAAVTGTATAPKVIGTAIEEKCRRRAIAAV